jgi:hypothetical protein
VLHRFGIEPGEKIELDKLPDGRVVLCAEKRSDTVDGFLGLLAGRTKKLPFSRKSTRRRRLVGPEGMRITVDTTILIRAVMRDDMEQGGCPARKAGWGGKGSPLMWDGNKHRGNRGLLRQRAGLFRLRAAEAALW